jgi:hypothetical protein
LLATLKSHRLLFKEIDHEQTSYCTSLAGAASTQAAGVTRPVIVDASLVTPVADGCGLDGWRGTWGHCHYRGWQGRPGYVYMHPVSNGCLPGFWRGPWGHCRNTPFHGRLPDGSWK